MQAAEGKVIVTVVTDKILPTNVSVSIGFPSAQSNWFVLRKLMRKVPCGCPSLANGSEATALSYAIFDNIEEKLIGNPLAQSKSKVSSVKCNFRNGEFSIHLMCSNTYTAVKKAITLAIKSINPHRLWSKYQANIILLNGKPKRFEFVTCVNDLIQNIMLNVVVVGKITIDQTKVNNLALSAANSFKPVGIEKAGTKPASLEFKRTITNYPTVIAKSFHAMLAVDFIMDATDLNAVVENDNVIVYDDKKMPNISTKQVDKYVEKYKKLKKLIKPIILYNASAIYNLDTFSLIDIISTDITTNSIKKIVGDTYKI